jgi:type II secretory pathway pseudopilin PulG
MASDKGFTILELLFSITLISFFIVISVLMINPRASLEKARDVQRFNDLQSIKVAISTLLREKSDVFLGNENTIYVSLPKINSATCSEYNLPIITSSYQYQCSGSPESLNGNGWIPVNFLLNPIFGFRKLLVDPVNKPPFFYAYRVKNKLIKLTMHFENFNNIQAAYFDGGNDPILYEIGDDLSLIVPENGLTINYHLEEGTSTLVKDDSGFKFNADLVNFDFSSTSGWTSGKIGKGLIFDGINDYVQSKYFYNTNNLKEFTSCLWFSSIIDSGPGPIILRNYTLLSFGTSSYWGLNLEEGQVKFYTRGSDGSLNVISSGDYDDGQWHFVCALYQATSTINKKLMIDGKIVASTRAHNGNPLGDNTQKYLQIGRDPVTLSNYFKGKIDEILLYAKALKEEELRMLYRLTK